MNVVEFASFIECEMSRIVECIHQKVKGQFVWGAGIHETKSRKGRLEKHCIHPSEIFTFFSESKRAVKRSCIGQRKVIGGEEGGERKKCPKHFYTPFPWLACKVFT